MRKSLYKTRYHLDCNHLITPAVYGEMLLYQIGRMYCREDTVVDRHDQLDCIELTIVTDGKGYVYTNDIMTPVEKGDIYISFFGDVHEIVSDPEELLKFDFVSFDTKNREFKDELRNIADEFRDESRRVFRDDDIAGLVSRATAEEGRGDRYSPRMMEVLITELIIHLIRDLGGMSPHDRNKVPKDAEIFCYSLMNYIDSHIYTMKSLNELSGFMNYSYNYLSNLYKEVTNDTLMNYYRKKRLETAKALLDDESLSVTKVAGILNYSSVYTFSRAFKDYFGYSPSDAKQVNKK